jgi:hypothetical protein
MQLLAQTEPRARAYVNHVEVEVMHIRIVDIVGHENWTIHRVYLDTTPPALLVDTPQDGEWTSLEAVMVTGSTEAEATIDANGITGELDYGRFSLIVPVEEGRNLLKVTATDKAGNQERVTLYVHRDTFAPELIITSPDDGITIGRDRVVVTGRVTDDNAVSVLVNGMAADLVDKNWSLEIPIYNEENQISISAFDVAGNTVSQTLWVNTDLVLPSFTALLMIDGRAHPWTDGPISTQSTTVSIELDLSERVVLRISGGGSNTVGPGLYTKDLLLEPGHNEFVVKVEDLVGNKASEVTFVVVGTRHPR